MGNLIDKITNTSLFTDEEKNLLIEKINTLDSENQEELEDIIDDYSNSMTSVFNKYKSEIAPKLNSLKDKSELSEDEKEYVEVLEKDINSVQEAIDQNS